MKKKWDSYFLGSGTPTFWLGLIIFMKGESWTPTFKILVRTLGMIKNIYTVEPQQLEH